MRRVLMVVVLAAVVAGCGGDDGGLQSSDDDSALLRAVADATRSVVPEACTLTWVGPDEGRWDDADSWSAGRLPEAADQVCVPRGTDVVIEDGEHQVASLIVGGRLDIAGGTLELTSTRTYSLVGDLRLAESATLAGAGSVVVTGEDELSGGELTVKSASTTADDPTLQVPCGDFTPPQVEQCPAVD